MKKTPLIMPPHRPILTKADGVNKKNGRAKNDPAVARVIPG
jgi:hypothetical protein